MCSGQKKPCSTELLAAGCQKSKARTLCQLRDLLVAAKEPILDSAQQRGEIQVVVARVGRARGAKLMQQVARN